MSSSFSTRQVGMIRIYMKPNDNGRTRRAGIFRKVAPLYRDLVETAKADGIMNAIAHHTHYGYSNHGPVHTEGYEEPNPHLTMCVELICERGRLEQFCRNHADLLAGKVIVYQDIEHWNTAP